MTKGGYQILDLSGVDFRTDTTSYVYGAYSKLESTRKATLVSGLDLDGEELKDMFVNFAVMNSNFVGYFSIKSHSYKITIGSSVDGNDSVTITDEGSNPA